MIRTPALIVAAAVALTAAFPAAAQDKMSDRTFLEAAKCRGLTAGAGGDTASLDSLLKKERAMREPAVLRSAQNAAQPAKGDPAELAAKRDKVCKAFVAG